MALYHNYGLPTSSKQIREKMEKFFSEAIEDEKFQSIEHVKEVVSWYRERSESKGEKVVNNHFFVSTLVDKTVAKLLEYAQPYFEATIIKQIGIKTRFMDGTVETNFTIGLIPIKPFVEFDKIVDGKNVYSIKVQLGLDTEVYIERFRIKNKDGKKSIEIERMGVRFELSLESVEGPGFSLDLSIKLKEEQIEISDVSLSF